MSLFRDKNGNLIDWTIIDDKYYCTRGLENNSECQFSCKECDASELIAEWTC